MRETITDRVTNYDAARAIEAWMNGPMYEPQKEMFGYFRCDCGWPAHGLSIFVDESGIIFISVQNSRHDLSLRQRIKSCLKIIRGEDHALSEIVLHRDEVDKFVNFVCSIK